MSDAEMSDANDEDNIVRQHEVDSDKSDDENPAGEVNENEYLNLSGEEEVKDGEDADSGTARKVDPTKKKITRKVFVLNTERLKGPKGVHTIEKLYEGFKFKGKGHEKEDLDRVLKRLEYWGFRLFPKLDFDDFLAKCENLGYKKDMQVFLKKYRMGMISADDNMQAENDLIEEEDEDRADDPIIQRRETELVTEIENGDFQRLFDEMEQDAFPQVTNQQSTPTANEQVTQQTTEQVS